MRRREELVKLIKENEPKYIECAIADMSDRDFFVLSLVSLISLTGFGGIAGVILSSMIEPISRLDHADTLVLGCGGGAALGTFTGIHGIFSLEDIRAQVRIKRPIIETALKELADLSEEDNNDEELCYDYSPSCFL